MRIGSWSWVVLSTALLLCGLGWPALMDPDEARYAEASRNMIASGDLVVPVFNGEPRLNKPPLLYWTQSLAMRLPLGSEAAARLPSAIAGVALLLLVRWWSDRRGPRGSGGPAAAALATTVIFLACTRLAIPDALLALWITSTLLHWHEATATPEPRARRLHAGIAAACCAAGVLTKGPVAIAVPAIVILAVAMTRGRRGLVSWRGLGYGLTAQVLLAGPWLAALMSRIGFGGLMDVLEREVFQRVVHGLDHPRPFYHFLLAFWVTFLPWSVAVPRALLRYVRPGGRADPAVRLIAVWLLVVVGFFTLIPEKNDAYLLPVAPAVAMLASWTLSRRTVARTAIVTGIVLLVLVGAASQRLSTRRSLRQVALEVHIDQQGPLTLLSYRLYKPSLVFYSGHPAEWITTEQALIDRLEGLPPSEAVAIVMTDRRLHEIRSHPEKLLRGFSLAGRQDRYVALLRPSASAPQPP